jgi:copper chaperone CopZ
MNSIEFKAQNIKCMGCVNTIREGLTELDDVDQVEVDLQQSHVTVTGHQLSIDELAEKMAALGYPLA